MALNIQRLTAALLFVLLLAGCAAPAAESDETAGPSEMEQPAQTDAPNESEEPIAYGLAYSASDGWNPYTCTSQENRTIFPLLYQGLFEVAPDFTASPVLCSSYTVSADERTYVFRLDPDARFSDGSALTSADVVASFDTAAASEYYASRFDLIAGYEATDTRTVTVTLSAAHGSLPLLLDIPIVKSGTADRPQPTGSGPYQFGAAGTSLTPVDNWWGGGIAQFGGAEIALVSVQSETDVRDAFELGEVSLVCADPNSGTASVYHSDYELWTCPSTVMIYLGFNQSSTLFSSAEVRAGVTHLIDRTSIVSQDFSGFAQAASLPASPLAACYDRSLAAAYDYDPDAFDATVPALGENETGILLVNAGDSARVAAAERIAQALTDAGFTIAVNALPSEEYQQALANGSYDCYLGEIRLTTDFSLAAFFQADGGARYGISGDETALALNALMLENEGNAYDLHRAVMDDGLLCPVLFKTYAVYCKRGAFTDLTAGPYNVFYSAPETAEE